VPETFHRRGNHVQKAHGRRTALAAQDSHLSGGMIALMPTAQDARRLALPGGEAPEELHCTLLYLGDDGSVFTPADRDALEEAFTHAVADYGIQPVQANIFGVAHWNGDGEKPSWVWSVGDNPDRAPEDDALEDMRALTGDALGMAMAMTDGELPEIPPQHSPWVAHICAAYTDDLTLVRRLEKGLGPVTFDRIRLSFGDDDRDIPLKGEALTASALRRDLLPHEQDTDFAEHNAQWESAVASADGRLVQVFSAWRAGIREQITAGIDTPDELTGLTADPGAAAEILSEAMVDLAHRAGQSLVRQAERQGVTVPDWSLPDDTVTAAVGGRKLLRSVAQMTADLLSSSVVQTAKRTVTGLFAKDASPETIATEVDRALADAQDGLLKGPVGTAMSTAQTAGREAVLRAAPPGAYYASEMLDKNTCGPCRAVDGEQFGSLEIAVKAYPVMGYKDCVGPRYGHSCRGLIVARWSPDEAQTASAATMRAEDQPEEEPVTTEALRKGKPSKGTKKDKRLDENQYADEGHFQGEVEVLGWNGSAARFTDPEYRKAAAGCDSGGTAKESCFLPHHEPGGALNKDGVHAAAQRVSSLSGHSPEAVARAKAHLRGHYKTLGEKPPDSLAATAEEIESFGVEDGYEVVEFESTCPPGTRRVKGGDCEPPQKKLPGQLEEDDVETLAKGDCPPGMEMDKTTGKCAEMQQMAVQVSDTTAPWRGPLTVEGIETGDGRQFDTGSLTWADLPLPLRWNIEDSHGGEARTKAVNVGRIDKIWREDSGLIMGEGVLDLGDDNGQAAQKKIEGKFLRGVSVDVDSVKDADMELIWPDHDPDGEGEADPFAQLFAAPEKVVFHKGRIRAATLVDIPAFAEAYIALLDGEGAVTAGGEPIGALRASQAPRTHLALAPPAQPPADWFRNPDLSVPTGITVSADGRVYGHAALWGTCHIGQAGVCVTPPQEDDHPYFMTGSVLLDDGEQASVGQITLGTGHAPLDYGHRQASDHYDNTGSAVADVSVGNDAHGIWVAGSIRPGTDPARIHELRASGQVSGDWRSIGGKLRLVGLLAVNVPGFPVPKLRTKYTSGRQLALVAAGMPDLRESMTEDDLDQWAYRRVLVKLAERVHRKR
jgi:hypothetical protein